MKKQGRTYKEMYSYMEKGNTLYDFLAKYTGLKDLSAEEIFNTFRKDLNLQQQIGKESSTARYRSFVNTYNKDISGRIVNSMLENLTGKEKSELLEKFRSVNPEKYDAKTVEGYIELLKGINFTERALIIDKNDETTKPVLNPEVEELNKILIKEAVNKADPELVSTLRHALLYSLLIPLAKKQILKENPETDESKNPELYKINFIRRLFSNEKALRDYDSALEYVRKQEEEARQKAQTENQCKIKRLSSLSEYTGVPISELLEKIDSEDELVTDAISRENPNKSSKKYEPREGDYFWSFLPKQEPEVIINEKIEHSKDGIENQDLTVVSYGEILYGRKLDRSTFDEMPLSLIGVTTFGNDGNKNYFLITTHKNMSDMVKGINKEYYKKVLFSPFVLEETMGYRNRFLPDVELDEDGNASLKYDSEYTILDMQPMELLEYAKYYPGKIGRNENPATIQYLCNSQRLFNKQMEKVYEAKYQRKDKDREEY